nr:MAG TPA: hypothetical protein [Caudoviricetes sp.]
MASTGSIANARVESTFRVSKKRTIAARLSPKLLQNSLYHKEWTQWCEQRDILAQLIMTKQLKTPKRSWGTTGITSGSLNAPK